METHSKVWVVIAAYNEESVIEATLAEVRKHPYSVVVVDDHSSDGTFEKASQAKVHVCRHALNLGQGAALQTGILFALRHGAEIVVTFDADGQHAPEDIPRMITPILEGRADVTLGSRFLTDSKVINLSLQKRMLLKAAVTFTRLTTGLKVTDAHNGFRAFHRRAAEVIEIRQNRMAHASEILTEISRKRLRYEEVPVTIRYTDYSLRKGQRISNSFNILWDVYLSGVHR